MQRERLLNKQVCIIKFSCRFWRLLNCLLETLIAKSGLRPEDFRYKIQATPELQKLAKVEPKKHKRDSDGDSSEDEEEEYEEDEEEDEDEEDEEEDEEDEEDDEEVEEEEDES
jgi:hypothetical protein